MNLQRTLASLTLLALLTGCRAPLEISLGAGPSAVVSSFDDFRKDEHAAVFDQIWKSWSRRGVTVRPPGHCFAHYSLTGELDRQTRLALLETMRGEMAAHLDASGAQWSGTWRPAIFRPPDIVTQLIGYGMSSLEGSWTEYSIDDRKGWAEVLSARPASEPGSWTVGCGVHEIVPPDE